jgi:copper transport protein
MRAAGLGLLLVAFVVAALPPGGAEGHAALAASDPAANTFLQRPPVRISLTFTEPVDESQSAIRVLDARGAPVATSPLGLSSNGLVGQVTFPETPTPGIYNVLWSNVSRIDGHGLRGSFPFTVLNPDGSVPDVVNTVGGISTDDDPAPLADGVAVRALSLLGLVIAAGGAALLLLAPSAVATTHRRSFERTILSGAAVLGVATLLNLASLRDVYSGISLADLVLETRTGGYWLMRLGATAAIAAAVPFVLDRRRWAALGALAGAGAYLWAYSATSHAAAGTGSNWAVASDVVHGLAAVLWMGAVVGLALTARLAGRDGGYRELMPRFGFVASLLVFLLIATGILSAFVEIDKVDRLTETRYGWTLVAKLGLLVPLLAVAGYNARWGRRAVEAGKRGAERRLVRTTVAEMALGGLVFVAAAMLTQTTVSKSIPDAPGAKAFEGTAQANDLNVALGIDPNRTGLNTYTVRLESGGQPAAAERVRLTFRYRDDTSVGPASLVLQQASAAGTFVGQGPYLTLDGQWRVETEVRRANVDDATAFFDVRPAGSAATSVRRGGGWDNPAPGLSWNEFGGFVILLAGLGSAIWGVRLGRVARPLGWSNNAMTMLCFGVGALLLFGVHRDAATPADQLKNPVFPDQNSITTGRTLFQENCASCHGQRGIPPKGLDLNPYPLDLTVHVPQHTDGAIFTFIHDGVPGSAMRAWGKEDLLSEEQIWHLVNFLRTLGTVDE